jgi:hypothetical protein
VLEHLSGWGHGHHRHSVLFPRQSPPSRRKLAFIVRGEGALVLRASGARVGKIETRIDWRSARG